MRFVITAGPTREHLDPVRFLSNPSTGKMGFALARAAKRRGHDVTLIAGPVSLKTPPGVRRVDVVSAREMLKAAQSLVGSDHRTDRGALGDRPLPTVFISTAAVADWRPATCAKTKLKKHQMTGTLKLVRNPDILKTLGNRMHICSEPKPHAPSYGSEQNMHLVGFAAETNDMLREAARKCREKKLDFIVANDVTEKGAGFGCDTNRVTLVFPDGTTKALPLMTKLAVANRIIKTCEDICL